MATKPKPGRPKKGAPAVPSILSIETFAAKGPWRNASIDERKHRREMTLSNIERVGTMRVAALAMGCREEQVPRNYGFRWEADYALALRRHFDVCYEQLVIQGFHGNQAAMKEVVKAQDSRFRQTEHKETIERIEEITHRVEGEISLRPTAELLDFIRAKNPMLANVLASPEHFAQLLASAQPPPILVNPSLPAPIEPEA